MGTYSKALEKAKDDSLRHYEPVAPRVDMEEETHQPAKVIADLPQTSPVEKVSPVSGQGDISEEMDGWDVKLREIIAGNFTQVSESIKMLRNKIYYPEEGKIPKSVLITSAIPGEGKSLVSASLGASIAQGINKEALLVECDLRRPSLSGLLNLSNSRGLVDYLQNGTPVEQLIQQTSLPNFFLLSSGKQPKNPAELIDSAKMVSLINDLEDQNTDRLIILDSPPIQAAAETEVLAKNIDKIIMVIRWGYSRREHVKQLVEMLGRDKILGVVFNAFEMSRLESKLQGYYYGYKDYYSNSYSKYYEQQPKKKRKKY